MPQRWQTYCIALCTRQTAGSCRAEFKGRPAPAPRADWLYACLVTAGQPRQPSCGPRPVTSDVSLPRRADAVTDVGLRAQPGSFLSPPSLAAGPLGGEREGRGAPGDLPGGGHFPERLRSWECPPPFPALARTLRHIPLPFAGNDFPLREAASLFAESKRCRSETFS